MKISQQNRYTACNEIIGSKNTSDKMQGKQKNNSLADFIKKFEMKKKGKVNAKTKVKMLHRGND